MTSPQEFARDIMLMFANAMIYNAPDSEVYDFARKVKQFAVKEIATAFPHENLVLGRKIEAIEDSSK